MSSRKNTTTQLDIYGVEYQLGQSIEVFPKDSTGKEME